ncbi:antA/AntB antirepressor family protein [Desulfopila sp. IMCC35006]|uniref:antA/AntB antirepressor family protein n=1 Tax=Desulfopila sp. IMCC35006 TaxID=2569542 RepID=UPI00142EDFB4|nr:antA/AntB antirepressor family protein [Desulfopila sp. IMCC35006]
MNTMNSAYNFSIDTEAEKHMVPVIDSTNMNGNEVNTVNARELHEKLGSRQEFANWIKNRIQRYDFTEGLDYLITLSKSTGGRPTTEYHLTIFMAKELCMVENNEQGKMIRKYFIECERRALEVPAYEIPQTLSEALLLAGQLAADNEKLQLKVQEDAPKVAYVDHVLGQSEGLMTLSDYGRVLKDKSLPTGARKIFEQLRERNVIQKGNSLPYDRYVDQGWFVVSEKVKGNSVYPTTFITPKGRINILRLIKEVTMYEPGGEDLVWDLETLN